MTDAATACHLALAEFFSRHPRVLHWGVAPARPTPRADLLRDWVEKGRHGNMDYMARRLRERMDPRSLHAWAESVVVFSFAYAAPLGAGASPYRVAAYARGADYHGECKAILAGAETFLGNVLPSGPPRFYGFVDTAPVFERDLASEAGLGWRAKNCCTLSREHGSGFHLAGFFLDLPLPASPPVEDFCGGCTRCLDQCPTQAFTGPGQLDATKCISYWTIEAKGALPGNLSDRFGGWIFGCDVCQEVCPWNRKHLVREASEAPQWPTDGIGWLNLLRKQGGFRSRFRKSPLSRAGRRSLLRNLAVAARNLKDTSLLEPLREALPGETDPDLREEMQKAITALGG